MIENTAKRLASIHAVSAARKHTLYLRSGRWYVHCMDAHGKSCRISTGCAERADAEAYVSRCKTPAPFSLEPKGEAERIWKRIENARSRAKKKGLPFAIGINDVRNIVDRSGGRCEVSGVAFAARGPFQPSLDRINPALGYTPENVRLVCLITNTAMLHYGEDASRAIAVAYCQKNGLV